MGPESVFHCAFKPGNGQNLKKVIYQLFELKAHQKLSVLRLKTILKQLLNNSKITLVCPVNRFFGQLNGQNYPLKRPTFYLALLLQRSYTNLSSGKCA